MKRGRDREFGRWFWFVGLILAPLVCYYLLWPFWLLYFSGLGTTTGERYELIGRLERAGPIGRQLARSYAVSWLEVNPHYCDHFILEHEESWIGLSRAKMRETFGPPDEVHPGADVWYIGFHYALKRFDWDPGYRRSQAAVDWTACLAAEYEDGRVVRLCNPVPGPEDPSPYRTHLTVELERDDLGLGFYLPDPFDRPGPDNTVGPSP